MSSGTNPGAEPLAEDSRRLFELKVLHEASLELSALSTPEQIARVFLLTALGGLRAGSGFVALTGTLQGREGQALIVHRGLGEADAARLEAAADRLGSHWLDCAPRDAVPRRAHVFARHAGDEDDVFPGGVTLMARWVQDGGRCGLLGLAPLPGQAAYGAEDREFLLSLLDCLQSALSRSFLTGRLAAMGQDLAQRNTELARRNFEQETLIQALSEMSAITTPEELLARYLLFLVGTGGARRGYVFTLDRAGSLELFAGRGMERQSLDALNPVRLRQTAVRELFASGGSKAGWIDDPEQLAGAGLPEGCPGLWFVAGEHSVGFAGLARRTPCNLDGAARETLLALTGAFTTCFHTVRLLEARRLQSEELAARNAELARMLDEITNARVAIDGLKQAKARIRDLVRREMERVSGAHWMDFALIVTLSVAVAFLFNWASPSGVEPIPASWSRPASPKAGATQAKDLLDAGGAVLIDARPQESFRAGHAAGAFNLTPALFDFLYGMRLAKVPPERPVLVYGRTVSRRYDEDVAHLLIKRGHKDVRVVAGGLEALRAAGVAVKP